MFTHLVQLMMQVDFCRPANLYVDRSHKVMPRADYDLLTAGNANTARTPRFDGLRTLLEAAAMPVLGNPASSSFNTAILIDLAYLGDGGLFTERIIAPMFQALAFELTTKGGNGCEPALRITYDDANESFVLPSNVASILQKLGCQCASQDTVRCGVLIRVNLLCLLW
jgi:hypothetical protein